LGCACASQAPVEWKTTEAEWRVANARLDAIRATEPREAYGMVVRVSLREPRSGKAFEGRGAVAVEPQHAMRMILLGPGGATALDAWITPSAFRFEVPPLHLLRRGAAQAEARLPVDFFREWFLAPLGGRLLASIAGPAASDLAPCSGQWFVLRRGTATMTVCEDESQDGLAIDATRRGPGALERLSFRGTSLSPHAGDRAEYEDALSGVRASVEVEKVDDTPPDPLAFADPDAHPLGPP
jgi:hypothetical protein